MEFQKYIALTDGEELLREIEGDAYNMDSSPIARLLGTVIRFISVIFGYRKKVYIIVTNKRVIKLEFDKMFWVLDKGVRAMSITPRAIKSVGYAFIRNWLIFKTRYFVMNSDEEYVFIKFKGNQDLLNQAVDNVTNTLETIKSK